MKLSIVTTLYQSADYIEEFCRRVSVASQDLAEDDYEIVLVNVCSPDDSLRNPMQLSQTDTHVVVVDLSRNFCLHHAMLPGLSPDRG